MREGLTGRCPLGLGVAAATLAALVVVPTSASVSAASSPASGQTAGITSSTVTVGQIDDLSAPIAGLFKGAEDGTQAYFNYINSKGGVDGRKILLDTRDSADSPSTVQAATRSIVSKDFAMVGGFSLLDNIEGPTITASEMPDIAYPLSASLGNNPYVYNPAPGPFNDTPTGPYEWATKAFPKQSKHIGILYAMSSATPAAIEAVIESAMRSTGMKITYDRGFNPDSTTTFLPDVLRMKSSGVQMYFNSEVIGFEAATLAQNSAQQSFFPVHIEGGGAYINDMEKLAGSAANGMYLNLYTTLYEGEDAKTVPAVAMFDKYVTSVDPKVFDTVEPVAAPYGWASAMLFVQALKAAGPHPTRAGLLAQLGKVTSFDAGGLLPPSDPAQNIPSKCFLVAQLKNGVWTRVAPTPKSGFVCMGTLEPQHGWKPENR
jgi:ABC-type branched-subunit amino acid transport system substrate-binding protein